jgi:hypothetical protein
MISSPCKNCPRKDLPKDDCAKDCKLLQMIQDVQISSEKNSSSMGIDYTEECRYTIPLSLAETFVSL